MNIKKEDMDNYLDELNLNRQEKIEMKDKFLSSILKLREIPTLEDMKDFFKTAALTDYEFYSLDHMMMIEMLLERVAFAKLEAEGNFDLEKCLDEIKNKISIYDNYHYEEVYRIYNDQLSDKTGEQLLKKNWTFYFKHIG